VIGYWASLAWRGVALTWQNVTLFGGAAVSVISPTPAPSPPSFEPGLLPVAAIIGAPYYLAHGADLPRSNRRFSRLR
jgi:hypothetical protein